jgi:peptide/nickel transport system permease protein
MSEISANSADTSGHYVNPAAFDPVGPEKIAPAQERLYLASGWRLMWWKLRRHKLAVISGAILFFFYAMIPFTEIIAPYALETRDENHIFAPPQTLRLFHDGKFEGLFVYGYQQKLNLEIFQREFVEDRTKIQHVRFFCSGDKYDFWGLFPSTLHFMCPAEGGTFFLLGTDRLGHDVFSRIIYGARISLTVGLFGVALSLVLGIVLGGLAGYYGGWVDAAIQRVIELLRSLPELPLWLALAAALPVTWSPVLVYFGITIILGLLDWPSLARAVRSKLLALREEDYALAAELMGARPRRIIFRHLMPNFASHLIASATLSIPGMILGETALSFLGLGLRPPITSWGVMLEEARNLGSIEFYPWILAPMVPVIIVVLAFNFFGDGLRDAADPYR